LASRMYNSIIGGCVLTSQRGVGALATPPYPGPQPSVRREFPF